MKSNGTAPSGVNDSARLNLTLARVRIGEAWGLGRPLTKAELARALRLSPDNGSDYIGRIERGTAEPSGLVEVAVEALLAGYVPPNLSAIIKPGYPRTAPMPADRPADVPLVTLCAEFDAIEAAAGERGGRAD